MYSCFMKEEQKYFVVLRPWGDQTPPLNYLTMCRAGLELPRNVRAYINESMPEIAKQMAAYKIEKAKYIRKKRTNTTNA